MTAIENTLQKTTSPYLLQHKDNPVAWQQWNEDVLALAQQQNKPILLSIGYSACHWCHVMARESFSDAETADLMNDMFVNIKVDREERPDIDEVYQTAHQLLTGRPGGWPLTVFLCPRTQLPFLIGTYFPKEGRDGQIGFKDLLHKVNEYYHSRGKDFIDTLDQVKDAYDLLTERENTQDPEASLSRIPIEKATADLLKDADSQWGGFGGAPKFPLPTCLERLWVAQYHAGTHATAARAHLEKSLTQMARSGVVDQVGGGFFRYATDNHWMIPHFEKMLYDNGLLLATYAQGWALFHEPLLEATAKGIADWALSEMRAPEGGFYSSLDAESDTGEGSYYLWDKTELTDKLPSREQGVMLAAYEMDKFPNFGERWHLHRERDWATIAAELEIDEREARDLLDAALRQLHQLRAARPAPARDDKIITAWNGLMIRGLAMAARVFDNPDYLNAAQQAVDFIRDNLWTNQRLYATWQQGTPKIGAFLHDYAYLMDGVFELLRTQWRDSDYRFVAALAESLIEHFEDSENGGFYFTAHDQPELIFRSKPFFDGVMPSGNGVVAKVFGRLGHLCAEPRYLDCARRTLLSGWASTLRHPKGHHSLLVALEEYLEAPLHVLLLGDESMVEWQRTIQQRFGELVHCFHVPADSEVHPPELFLLDDNQGLVCIGDHCLEPAESLDALLAQLGEVLSADASFTSRY